MSSVPALLDPPVTPMPRANGWLAKLHLPEEVTTAEAAEILGCDTKTVRNYLRSGLLRWRNIAPPTSTRPEYRIELESVLAIRTGYRTTPVIERKPKVVSRRSIATTFNPKHISLD